eukprot:750849-Hanusia_phi.AAC.2
MDTKSIEVEAKNMEEVHESEHSSTSMASFHTPVRESDSSLFSPSGAPAVNGSINDPDGGAAILRRSLEVAEREISELRKKLKKSHERCEALEREREERYVKMKAEIYENSMSLMREVQKGHNDSQEISARRIAFLERELDAARSECASMDHLSRELEMKRNECNELQEALEELENEKGLEIAAAVEQACADLRKSLQRADSEDGNPCVWPRAQSLKHAAAGVEGITDGEGSAKERLCEDETDIFLLTATRSVEDKQMGNNLNQTVNINKYTDEEYESISAQLERVSEDKESLQH